MPARQFFAEVQGIDPLKRSRKVLYKARTVSDKGTNPDLNGIDVAANIVIVLLQRSWHVLRGLQPFCLWRILLVHAVSQIVLVKFLEKIT